MSISNVQGVRPVAAVQAPKALPVAAGQHVRARAADPLPTFNTPGEYRNYVINLVSLSRATQAELERERQALNNGTGNAAAVGSAAERLDAIKLQLALLRDSFPIPESWTRWKIFGGHGFDKEKFWREQVEAIPGKEVLVSPEPAKPAPAPVPATIPAPVPAVVPAGQLPTGTVESKIRLARLAKENTRYNDARDAAVGAALGDAVLLATNVQECLGIAVAARELLHFNDNRDKLLKQVLAQAVYLAKTPAEAVQIAATAKTTVHFNDNRDKLVEQALLQGINLSTSVNDLIGLADGAKDAVHFNDNRDKLVKRVLEQAIVMASSFGEIEAIITAATRTLYYNANRDQLVAKALEKSNT